MPLVGVSRTALHHIPQKSCRLTATGLNPQAASRTEKFAFCAVSTLHIVSSYPKFRPITRHVPAVVKTTSVLNSYSTFSTTSGSRRLLSKKSIEGNVNPSAGPISSKTSTKETSPNSTASPDLPTSSDQPFPAPYHHPRPAPPPRSPLTKWILASPRRTEFFLRIGDWLGYGSPKQMAATRSKVIYNICSAVARGPEQAFWYETLSLPPSFQSWFTITNLHVWLVTVRLRALPAPHGRPFIQALIDHFFFDVEDRLRAVLGKKAPERLVTRNMKILREQWGGLGLAFDHALITGDKDMASAIWRNLLGARAAQGISYSDSGRTPSETGSTASGGSSQARDDPASGGVVDFEGNDVDKYVLYPELMLTLVGYLRRELVRLEEVNDTDILGGVGRGIRVTMLATKDDKSVVKDLRDVIRFGRVRDAARKVCADANIF